jgi:DNA-binding MarR family transcriptional regulator
MFGRSEAIRDPSAAPEFFPDYREKLDPALRWTNRIYPDGTWEANLFQFYQRVSPQLAAGLPTPFQLDAGMRKDDTPAHEALREAFVNTLIHADHTAPGGIVVERLPDRFIVSNPGTLLVSMEQFRRGGVSECRNPSLQQMFLMIGGGERAGSGVDKIRSGWRTRHWRPPLIRTQTQPDRVEMTLPMVSLIPESAISALDQRFGKAMVAGLAADALQALATIEIEGSTTNTRLQELIDCHPSDITRLLQNLCNRGLLESDNRRRWSTYRFKGTEPERSLFDDLEHSGDSSHKTGLAELEMSETATKVSKSERSTPDLVKVAILDLCRGRFWTVNQLANMLNRHPAGLRNRYITPLVEAEKLKLRFPRQGNRPDQAYTTNEAVFQDKPTK